MKIAITGSTGFIGRRLCATLRDAGETVVPIVRREAGPGEISWDPAGGVLDVDDLDGVDAVIHLSGAGIGDRRWSDAYRKEIVDSRIDTTTLLARTIADAPDGPKVLLSGSAIGIYGDSPDATFDETSEPGEGFLADLCVRWEGATKPAEEAGCRVVHLRTGIVLDGSGGVLAKQLPIFKAGVGGRLGDGSQWLSWITLDDHVSATRHLLTSECRGPVNLTAPEPVTNGEFTKTLGRVLGRPTVLPVPKIATRLALGADRSDNLLFASQRVIPAVLLAGGFSFDQPELEGALRTVLDKPAA